MCLSPVIIPKLHVVAVENNVASNLTRRRDVALVLLDCYRNISECCILVIALLSSVQWHVVEGGGVTLWHRFSHSSDSYKITISFTGNKRSNWSSFKPLCVHPVLLLGVASVLDLQCNSL